MDFITSSVFIIRIAFPSWKLLPFRFKISGWQETLCVGNAHLCPSHASRRKEHPVECLGWQMRLFPIWGNRQGYGTLARGSSELFQRSYLRTSSTTSLQSYCGCVVVSGLSRDPPAVKSRPWNRTRTSDTAALRCKVERDIRSAASLSYDSFRR